MLLHGEIGKPKRQLGVNTTLQSKLRVTPSTPTPFPNGGGGGASGGGKSSEDKRMRTAYRMIGDNDKDILVDNEEEPDATHTSKINDLRSTLNSKDML